MQRRFQKCLSEILVCLQELYSYITVAHWFNISFQVHLMDLWEWHSFCHQCDQAEKLLFYLHFCSWKYTFDTWFVIADTSQLIYDSRVKRHRARQNELAIISKTYNILWHQMWKSSACIFCHTEIIIKQNGNLLEFWLSFQTTCYVFFTFFFPFFSRRQKAQLYFCIIFSVFCIHSCVPIDMKSKLKKKRRSHQNATKISMKKPQKIYMSV